MSTSKREIVQFSSYSRKLKDNVKSMLDNYTEIVKAAKVPTAGSVARGDYDAAINHSCTEIQVRAANMVKAAESLSELVAEIKEYLILNDFSSINGSLSERAHELKDSQKQLKDSTEQMFETYKQRQLQALKISNNDNNE